MQALPFGGYGFGICVLIVGIMLAVAGIALGLGYAINDRRLKEFGKEEIVQSVVNGALVGGLLVLFVSGGPIDTLIGSAVAGSGAGMSCSGFMAHNAAICFAYNYLVGPGQYYFMGSPHDSILTGLMSVIIALVGLYAGLGFIKTFVSPLMSMVQSAVQALGAAAISATVQASVLSFIAASTVTVILPAGLVLRALYPTRKTGAFLIALAISLYVVLPMTYLMNAAIAGSYASASGDTSSVTLGAGSMMSAALSAASGASGNSLSFNSSVLSFVSAAQAGLSNFLDAMFNLVASFIVYAFILPAFSLVLTGISVREMSRMLGSDTFFGKFSLL